MGSRREDGFGERALLAWIRSRMSGSPGESFLRIDTGIGDDAAVLASEGGDALVVTTDMLIEGVHFRREEGLSRIGRKAMAASLSDVAAMGCSPRFAFVAAGLAPGTGESDARKLVEAMSARAAESGAAVLGGDVVAAPGGLTLSVTVLGTGRLDRVVRRSGARPGDRILVTGELGGSRLGRHLDFEPRVEESARLVSGYEVHAMIDVSDGLSTDLHHLLEESGVGARIEASRVPVSADARRAAEASGRTALAHALDDGEDFELLFAMAPSEAKRLLGDPPFETRVTDLGELRPAEEGCVLVDEEGRSTPLRAGGHEHLR